MVSKDSINLVRKYTMKKLLITAVCLFSLSSGVNGELNLELPDLNLPSLGGANDVFITSSKERNYGLRILRRARAKDVLIEDPEISLWIRSLGNKLTAQAPNTSSPFYFAVAKNLSVNAYATLGGVIVVNAGLILRSDSESELASVIAHEIAHVTQRHIQRIIAESEKNKFATGAALVAGAIVATQNPEAAAAVLNTTLAASAHQQLAFGRNAESEADRVGLRILASAGFNPHAAPSFLRKLERFDHNNLADIREFLQSHPLSVNRVSDTVLRANQYGDYKGKENVSYLYMKEKLRALMTKNMASPNDLPTNIKNYADTYKLKQKGSYLQALQLSQFKQTRNISEAILLAQLYNRQNQSQQTIALLKPLLDIYPGNESLSVPLARAYLFSGRNNQAWSTINAVHVSEQTSLELFEIKQEIARVMGNQSLGFRQVAERSLRTGNYEAAELQFKKALKLPGSTAQELQEIQQTLAEIKTFRKTKK